MPGQIAGGPAAGHARDCGDRVQRGVFDLAGRDARSQNRNPHPMPHRLTDDFPRRHDAEERAPE